MSKRKKEKEEVKVIHENLRELTIPDDFFSISKECRESYYYLESLKALFEQHIQIKENYKPELITSIRQRISELEQLYESADEVATAESENVQDQFKPFSVSRLMELPEGLRILRLNIELKAKLDKLQIDILDYLMDIDLSIINKLEKKKLFLARLVAQFRLGYLMNSVFNRSTEEDRIVTYKFSSKDRDVKLALKKLEDGLADPVKIRDYTYLLNTRREQYKYCRQYSVELMMKIPKLEEEEVLNDISKQQFIYNKRIALFTYIIVFLTVVTTITSIGQLYFASKGSDYKHPILEDDVTVTNSVYEQVSEEEEAK